jgi:hypothetical protein
VTKRTLLAFIACSAMVANASAQQTRTPEGRTSGQPATTPSKCLNLSGQYLIQGEDGQVRISIEQQRCERISIIRRSGYLGRITSETHTLTLDGKVRKDLPWFGGSDECCETSAAFVGPTLRIEARAAQGPVLTITYSLTPARDILEEVLDGHGLGPMLARRQN